MDESPMDSEAMNGALKPIFLGVDPRAAVELCLSAAEAADAEVAAMTADLIAAIEASPTHFRPNRSLHRYDHLNEIEALVSHENT